jgi:AraC-like DNA-binding protein
MTGTVFALIVQGAKRLALGDRVYEYRAGQYLVASVDLPVTGHFTEAPALGFGLTLRPETIAELLLSGMSVSAFYRNFQAVTAMSPIQFQKQIRLQQARLLLATHPNDVTAVSHRVGYDSPSQFSREYRRQFGAPPNQDAARLRDATLTPALSLP